MFDTIKSKVDLLEVISKDLDVNLKESGTDTYSIEDEEDYGGCPFCRHNGCFKVKQVEGVEDFSESMFKCFSCDEHGSVIDWVAKRNSLSLVDAAKKLSKDYNVPLPNNYNPMQELFTVAATYYRNCLLDTSNKPVVKLSHMTPLEYQQRVRKHSLEALEHFQVGWSDGKLVPFLEALGYDSELLFESGLKNRKHGRDFLPNDCFIYPHFSKGKVSHFTFKDPLKKIAYQLPNKFVLNGAEFYNQDSIKLANTVLIVEGENDVISSWENADSTKIAVIGTIGTISGNQLDWIRENLSSKDIITAFDPDDAGNKYREKLDKIKGSLKNLSQVMPPDDKDIDDILSKGGVDLVKFLNDNLVVVNTSTPIITSAYRPPAVPSVSTGQAGVEGLVIDPGQATQSSGGDEPDSMENNSIVERDGAYYKLKFKDGEPIYTKVSNCTIRLLNVYNTEESEKLREIIVTKENGVSSDPVLVDSDTKTSIRNFRILLARAADADFKGSDFDLSAMWELVYSKSKEAQVRVTRTVGRNDKLRGWIFRNKFISDTGAVVDRDENGIFWLNGKTQGLKPKSLHSDGILAISEEEDRAIPYLDEDITPEGREELLKTFLQNLARNLGDVGTALLLTGWMNSCAYSNTLFKMNRSFPMLFVWSTFGQGKGSICSWLMDTYDLADSGRTAISRIKSGVGLGRKASYYASLPLWIDEVRADEETANLQGTFRDYFDRGARDLGTKDGHGIKSVAVRSCFMFAGEDQFTDQATKDRCVVIRLSSHNREKVESFEWMEGNKTSFSAIGLKWIIDSVNEDHEKLKEDIRKLDTDLKTEAKCSPRKSKSWAVMGLFAIRMAEKYFPGFDMRKHLYKLSAEDAVTQKAETTVSQFFESVEGIVAKEGFGQTINDNHIGRVGDKLHLWFAPIYKAVQDEYRGQFTFSRNAVLAALREEKFFVSDSNKVVLGLQGLGTKRHVITLDLTKCPDSIRNIAKVNE